MEGSKDPNNLKRKLHFIYIEIRFSCAYWLLSVICLLGSHLSNKKIKQGTKVISPNESLKQETI